VKSFTGAMVLAGISLLARNKPFEELLKSVPQKARLKSNPMEGDLDARAAGWKLFEQHCAACHGRASEGGRKGPSLAGMEIQRATPGEIFYIITNGVVRHGMPSWSRLPEPERWQIVTFLRSHTTRSPLADVPEKDRQKPNPLAGDPDAPADGGKLFAHYCAPCHGGAATGVGKAPSLVNSWIQHTTPGELFWVITNGATAGGMPAWSKLSETQRWQIVAFLTTFNRP